MPRGKLYILLFLLLNATLSWSQNQGKMSSYVRKAIMANKAKSQFGARKSPFKGDLGGLNLRHSSPEKIRMQDIR